MFEVSALLNESVRTVRRRIRNGSYAVVRLSPRRLRIDVDRSIVGTYHTLAGVRQLTIADLLRDQASIKRHERRARAAERRAEAARELQRQRLIADRVDEFVRCFVQRPSDDFFFSVPKLARLCGRSKRSVYHDVLKGALSVNRVAHFGGRVRLWIRLSDAIAYAHTADEAQAIIALVSTLIADDDDTATKIGRGFTAWLATALRASAPRAPAE